MKRLVEVLWRLGDTMGSCKLDDEAVSPVIATVLLLAITVMLSSMVFVMMQGALTATDKAPPQATVSVRALDNGFHVIRITSLDQSIDPMRLQYTLAPLNTSAGQLIDGKIGDSDVYGVIGTNISFQDRDAGFSVTQGDYVVIDSERIGSTDGKWQFTLVDLTSNAVIVRVNLPAMT